MYTISPIELEHAINRHKEDKASGTDNILLEYTYIKAEGRKLQEVIREILNMHIRHEKIFEKWFEARLIILFKKDPLELEN